jgi:hypothetical protein
MPAAARGQGRYPVLSGQPGRARASPLRIGPGPHHAGQGWRLGPHPRGQGLTLAARARRSMLVAAGPGTGWRPAPVSSLLAARASPRRPGGDGLEAWAGGLGQGAPAPHPCGQGWRLGPHPRGQARRSTPVAASRGRAGGRCPVLSGQPDGPAPHPRGQLLTTGARARRSTPAPASRGRAGGRGRCPVLSCPVSCPVRTAGRASSSPSGPGLAARASPSRPGAPIDAGSSQPGTGGRPGPVSCPVRCPVLSGVLSCPVRTAGARQLLTLAASSSPRQPDGDGREARAGGRGQGLTTAARARRSMPAAARGQGLTLAASSSPRQPDGDGREARAGGRGQGLTLADRAGASPLRPGRADRRR